MVGAQLLDVLQDRLQVVHRLRIALRLPGHVVRAQEVGDLLRVLVVEEAHARAVEAGVADHLELLRESPLRARPAGGAPWPRATDTRAAFARPQLLGSPIQSRGVMPQVVFHEGRDEKVAVVVP